MTDRQSPVRPGPGQRQSLLGPGAMIDHYKVTRLLALGGMGEVYLAQDTKLGRKVALKVIRPENIGSRNAIARFIHEARATARFNHPHIVTLYAAGEYGNTPYVALEYLEGQTLRDRLNKEAPSVNEALRIALAIAEALKEAHRHNVLHRDLKPENVLIPPDGRIRVVDFGLAEVFRHREGTPDTLTVKSLLSSGNLTRSKEFEDSWRTGLRGSPPYMSPELWLEQPCTGAADIWSLGIILFEMLADERPYDESSIIELAARVASPDPVPGLEQRLADQSGSVPPELVSLTHRCLLKEAEKRPLAHEVVDLLRGLVIGGRRKSSADRNPFRGIRPYTEAYADLFMGREGEIQAFLERIRETAILPVVGPSGVGKTSFIQAGVIPRLREQGGWTVLQLSPGRQPFRDLAARLLGGDNPRAQSETPPQIPCIPELPGEGGGEGPADLQARSQAEEEQALADRLQQSPAELSLALQRLAARDRTSVLLFVDQIETLHTLVEDETVRRRFLEALCNAADDPAEPVRVVFALREDMLGRLTRGAGVREALSRATLLRCPEPEVLEEILVRPVDAVGYRFSDPELAREIVSAIQAEPTALALLQFTARALWERRDTTRRLVKRSAYRALGGVAGILAEHADSVLESLSGREAQVARNLLLRLVTPQRSRRVLSQTQVTEGLDQRADVVLDHLIRCRLLVVRKSYGGDGVETEVELAHDSLISSWKMLAHWIDESLDEVIFLQEATQAAELWERRGRRPEEVWRGRSLADGLRAMAQCSTRVPQRVRQFLEAGRQRQRRTSRRWLLLSGLVLCLLLAGGLLLFSQKKRAETVHRQVHRRQQQVRSHWAAVLREGVRTALAQGRLLEARARLRSTLEAEDATLARALWFRLTMEPTRWVKRMEAEVHALAMAPDGQTLAVAGKDRIIYLLDTRTLAVRFLRGHTEQVLSLAFSPDGRVLVSGSFGGRIRLWDLQGERGRKGRVLGQHRAQLHDLAFSPDGRMLASASQDRTVKVWDMGAAREIKTLRGHKDAVRAVRFSPTGRYIASAGQDQEVRLWEVGSFFLTRVLKGHAAAIFALSFSPDGMLLATASQDRTARLWDVAAGQARRVLKEHRGRVDDVAFSPDGKVLVSASADQSLRLWEVSSGILVREILCPQAPAHRVLYGPQGRSLATASSDRTVRLTDLGPRGPVRVGQGHAGNVRKVAFAPGGDQLASAGGDGRVLLWDLAQARVTGELAGRWGEVRDVQYSPDGRHLATGHEDRAVRLWDRATREMVRVLQGHRAPVNAVSFSADSRLLATAGEDETVRLWSWHTMTPGQVLQGPRSGINDLAFSPKGTYLAAAMQDGTVLLWNLAAGAPARPLRGHEAAVRGLSFSPSGQIIASTSDDWTVRLWDLATGSMRVLTRVTGRSSRPVFHPGGELVGVPLSDGTARTFNLRGEPVAVIGGHLGEVQTFHFSPDGSLAATGGDDGTVRLWEMETGRSRWRAPLMLASPPCLLTHEGWIPIGGAAGACPPARGRWSRAVESQALTAAMMPAANRLCLHNAGGAVEIWDTRQDRALASFEVGPPRQLLAAGKGCVALVQRTVHLLSVVGKKLQDHVVDRQASAVAWDRASRTLLVASGERVRLLEASGRMRAEIPTEGGVSAVILSGEQVVLGFVDGNIEQLPARTGVRAASVFFSDVPASPVVRLIQGPPGTVIAGYANGLLGIWSLKTGTRLYSARLHGPVVHLLLQKQRLFAATELGSHLVLDLGVFYQPYCSLLRQVWQEVPVVWEHGHPVLRPPPAGHPCGRPSASRQLPRGR